MIDITYTVSNLVNGQVELTTVPGVAVTSFTQDDVDNGLVVFVHDSSDTLTSGFDVSLADGGRMVLPSTGTVVIGFIPVDDAPTLDVNAGGTVAEGGTLAITTAELSSSDSDTADTALVYTVSSGPLNGQIELTSAPGVAVTSFTQDDLVNGLVVYVHDGETLVGDFDFEVADATTTLATATFGITVTPVNDAPQLVFNEPSGYLGGRYGEYHLGC